MGIMSTKETFLCSYFSVLCSPALRFLPNVCPNVMRPRLCSCTCYITFTGKENIDCVLKLCALLVMKKHLKYKVIFLLYFIIFLNNSLLGDSDVTRGENKVWPLCESRRQSCSIAMNAEDAKRAFTKALHRCPVIIS